METTLNTMWTSFSASIPQLESMVVGFAYILGIGFIFYAITLFHDLVDRNTKQNVKGGVLEPVSYFLGGSVLLWLPSFLPIFEETLFGTTSPLAYSSVVFNNMPLLQNVSNYAITETLELVGIIFFVRGVALMAVSSAPGTQHGMRGLVFVIAGILSVNFPATFALIQATISNFVTSSHSLTPIHQNISNFFN